jgi:hypothetical protein
MRQFEKLYDYLNLSRKDPDYNRFYIAYVYLFFSLSLFSAFIPINYFLLEKHPMTYPLAALAPISAGTIYYLFKTRNIDAVSYITAAILATFLFAVALLGEPHASTVTMAVIFPGIVFFLLGHRRGALSFLLFFPVFGLLFWWNTIITVQPVSQVNVAINTILALVLVTIQLFFYELARKEATDEKKRTDEAS